MNKTSAVIDCCWPIFSSRRCNTAPKSRCFSTTFDDTQTTRTNNRCSRSHSRNLKSPSVNSSIYRIVFVITVPVVGYNRWADNVFGRDMCGSFRGSVGPFAKIVRCTTSETLQSWYRPIGGPWRLLANKRQFAPNCPWRGVGSHMTHFLKLSPPSQVFSYSHRVLTM